MDNTSSNQVNVSESVPSPDVIMEGAGNDQPAAPENRRMTRGMRASGGVPPPVAPRAKAPRKRKAPKVKKEDPEEDAGQPQDSHQPPVKAEQEEGE